MRVPRPWGGGSQPERLAEAAQVQPRPLPPACPGLGWGHTVLPLLRLRDSWGGQGWAKEGGRGRGRTLKPCPSMGTQWPQEHEDSADARGCF